MKSLVKVILLSLALVFTFTTCENPVGLGAKVNTEKPVIRNAGDENQPGSFIQGDGNRIWLDVEQEFGIDKVFMEVEYTNKTTGATEKKIIDAVYAVYDEEKGQWKWYVDLDTSNMEDGTIKAWVTAIDVNGNTTTTTDIVYFVKNTPPQIKLNMPLVDGDNWDNDVFLDNLKKDDPLYIGFELMGLATDNYGIAEGYPKIMIWPEDAYVDLDKDGIPVPGGLYGSWYSLVVPNARNGLTATKFTWPMKYLVEDPKGSGNYRLPKEEESNSLTTGTYRVRIMTKDLFGNENYYPNRTDNKRGPGGQSMNPDEIGKKYIEIKYQATDLPIIQVNDYPQFYNAVKDFELNFSVSSTSDVMGVTASIVDSNDISNEHLIGGPYTPASEGKNITYKYKLTITAEEAKNWLDKTNGTMYVKLRAWTDTKEGPFAYQYFTYDDTPPSVVFDRPVSLIASPLAGGSGKLTGGAYEIFYPNPNLNFRPPWVTGTIQIGGSSVDDSTQIKQVLFHIGKLNDDNKTTAEREAIYAAASWTDTLLDKPTKEPGWSGSLYSWIYKIPQSPYLKTYKASNPLLIQELSELNGYPRNQYSETLPAPEFSRPDSVRFYLPFYVKVIDSADNFKIVHYKLCVDPDLDDPVVTITQPEKGATVGGNVRLAGSAEDNYWMHTVLVRVKRNDNSYPVLVPPVNKDGIYYLPPGALKFYDEHPSYPKPADTAGWFETTKIGDSSMVNWWVNINGDKALEPPASSPYGTTVDVTIEAIALDCAESDPTHKTTWKVGPIETWALKFSKDVPSISTPVISKTLMSDRTYTESMKVSGTFTFSFDVEAVTNIKSLEVRINGSTTPVRLVTDTQPQSAASWTVGQSIQSGDKVKRSITVTIDSITGGVITPIPIGASGELKLEIEAVDNTSLNLRTTNTFNLGIDNFYPTAEIQTSQVASENTVTGKYFYVEGKAKDFSDTSGNIQGIERVLVYFESAQINYDNYAARTGRKVTGNTNYMKPNGAVAASGDFVTYPNVMDHNGPSTLSPLPTLANYNRFPKITQDPVTKVWKSDVAMVIDYQEGGGTADGDGDGTQGETWGGAPADRDFGARVNFSGWKDGPYIVHYLVMDQAGNATHYYKDIYLENNKPRITSINLGTDINGDNNVTASPINEYLWTTDSVISAPSGSQQYGQMSPATSSTRPESTFRVRGSRFDVRLGVEKGNGAKQVLIDYAVPQANITAPNMKKGNVYTIVSQGSGAAYTDFTKYGAPNNIEGTTFVATGGPLASSGAGTVTPYALSNSYSGPMSQGELLKTFPFENFGSGIPDSEKYISSDTPPSGFATGDIKTDKHSQRFFIIRVRDSTLAALTNTGSNDPDLDNLVDTILLKMDIDNKDDKAPAISVLPFGKEYTYDPNEDPPMNTPANDKAKFTRNLADTNAEYIRNIGMNSSTEKGGYVQYAYMPNNTTINDTGTAYVSGKVKFLGKAVDNQRLGEILVTIPGYNGGAQFTIARANSSGRLEAVTPSAPQKDQWEFKLDTTDYLTLDYGHTLNWEFMWDSSYHSSSAENNVTITFEVRDAMSPKSGGTVRSSTSQIRVNIVPYISDIVTALSSAYASTPSAFSRSALGGYPVRETETITIKGFNLGNFTTNTAANNVRIGSVDFTISSSDRTTTTIKGTVPSTAVSGGLVVTVNSIPSFNNSGSKNKSPLYNQEKNGVNNNNLDNSRYLYVWKTGGISTDPVANMNTPFMRMDSGGNRYLSYGYYGTTQSSGALKVQKNNGAGIDIGAAYSNRMINTTVAFSGNGSFYAAGTDLSSAYNNNRGFQLARSNPSGAALDPARANAFGAIRIISMYNSISDRFKIPRIAVQPTNGSSARTDNLADRVLMSFYDEVKGEVRVIYGNVGSTYQYNTSQANAQGGTSNLTPGATPTDGGEAAMAASAALVTNSGSMYTACGLLSNGVPVIAWFDSAADRLYFSYDAGNNVTYPLTTDLTNTSRVATDSSRWLSNRREIDIGKGTDVDLIVDPEDNVHLAYYDVSKGGLWYAKISPNTPNSTTTRPTGAINKVKVDTFLTAGTNIMLNVRRDGSWYVPYISYYHGSFTKSKNSIRIAWQKNATLQDGCDGNDMFTGSWEVMTVPAETVPVLDFVCNGVPTSASWTTPTTGTWPANISKSILVGYFTSSYYEGAVLKDDMTQTPTILQKQ